jgi:REP element-mobilizing transposase RayT
VIAFHLIISAYGFWVPNDPRGSWSDFVGSWELLKFGPATKVNDRRSYAHDPHDVAMRREAKRFLKFPPVRFNDAHRESIAQGFGRACCDGAYRCFACCIGFDHAHLVIETHPRGIPVIAGHLKAVATRELTERGVHPLDEFIGKRGTLPTPWSEGCWKVFIDEPAQLNAAIRYVAHHPIKESLSRQQWDFVCCADADQKLS